MGPDAALVDQIGMSSERVLDVFSKLAMEPDRSKGCYRNRGRQVRGSERLDKKRRRGPGGELMPSVGLLRGEPIFDPLLIHHWSFRNTRCTRKRYSFRARTCARKAKFCERGSMSASLLESHRSAALLLSDAKDQ